MCPVTPNQDQGRKKQRDETDDLESIKPKSTKDAAVPPRSVLQPTDSNGLSSSFHDNFSISFIGLFPSLVHESLDEVKSSSNRQFLRAVSSRFCTDFARFF